MFAHSQKSSQKSRGEETGPSPLLNGFPDMVCLSQGSPQTTSSTPEVITIATSGALLAIFIMLVFALLVNKTAGILVVAGSDSRVSHSH